MPQCLFEGTRQVVRCLAPRKGALRQRAEPNTVAAVPMEAKLTAASELAESKPAAAAAQFEALIVDAETSEDAIKVKESA